MTATGRPIRAEEGPLLVVMSDVHSPDYFRVNGTLPNIDAWYEAFNVQPSPRIACGSGRGSAGLSDS
jgi:predicted metalloendopeptidase